MLFLLFCMLGITTTRGPLHYFNGHKANFYISTGQGSCSVNGKDDADIDAEYFCASFYGPDCKASSYEIGNYQDSGRMGYEMHKNTGCSSSGEDIAGTDCSGVRCKIWSNDGGNNKGLYDIICLGICQEGNRSNKCK